MSWFSDFTGVHIGGDTLDKIWEPIKNPIFDVVLPAAGAVAGGYYGGPWGAAAGAGGARALGGIVKGEELPDTIKNSVIDAGAGYAYGANVAPALFGPESGVGVGAAEIGTESALESTIAAGALSETPSGYIPLSSLLFGGGGGSSLAANPTTAAPWYSTITSSLPSLSDVGSTLYDLALPAMIFSGLGLNSAGNYKMAKQQNENLEEYRGDSAWTPERIQALTSGVEKAVGNVYAPERRGKGRNIAEGMAELGRSGGSVQRAAFEAEESTREAKANAITSSLLKSGVFTPPGQITGPGAYMEQDPWASTMTGASGVLGNTANAMLTLEMMKRLYPSLKR